jgi:hypothetical protein
MSDTTLVLGPVIFQDFEVPSGVGFGGRQRLAVHRLVGGARVVDSLGRDDAEITFRGIFSGADAMARACAIDALRESGLPIPLTWDVAFYTVVVSRFLADYQNSWWIPFQLTCTVVRDETAALIDAVASLAVLAVADVVNATTLASTAGLDLTGTQAAISAPQATVQQTGAYTAAQSSLTGAQTALASAAQSSEATMSGVTFSGSFSADAGIANLTTATGTAQQLASLAAAQAYLGRASANMAGAST